MSIDLSEKELRFIISCVGRRMNELSVLQSHSLFPKFSDEYDFASDLLGDLEITLDNYLHPKVTEK